MNASTLYQRKRLFIELPVALLAVLVMVLLWMQWPIPAAHLTITSGQPEGVYYANAKRYAEKFAHYGVTLDVLESAGSPQNLKRLQDAAHTADLAFVQGGFGYLGSQLDNEAGKGLQTLATVDIEPVWIFSSKQGIDSLAQLKGFRVSIGAKDSGSRFVAESLLKEVRLQAQELTISELTGMAAVTALQKGELDAMIFVSSPSAMAVKALMASASVQLVQLKQSSALAERVPYLEPQLLAEGKFDASGKYPPKDMVLLTTTASLVTRESLAPALKRLATHVTKEVHQQAGILHQAGEFPSLRRLDFASASQSRAVLAHGLSWVEATFPFWWAQLLTRLLLICLPIMLLAWWLARVIPGVLLWRMQTQVSRWYGELKYIEHDLLPEKVHGLSLIVFGTRLKQMERELTAFNAPSELMPRYFTLRHHFDFVSHRLQKKKGR